MRFSGHFSKKIGALLLFFAFLASTAFKLPDEGDEGKAGPDTSTVKEQQLFGPRNGEAMRLSLDQCVQRALIYNPEMQVADYGIEVAREKKKEVSKLGHPILDYEYDVGPVPKDVAHAVTSFFEGDISVENKFHLGVGVPVETFGKVKVGKQLAETGIAAEREKKVQKKSDIILRVKQLYYGILLAREVGHLLKSAHDSLDNEVKKREAAGGTDPSDLLKLKLFRADLEKKMEEGDKREILARDALRIQLGLDSAARFDIGSDKLRPVSSNLQNFESYKNQALEQRSDLKLLGLGYQAKKQQVQLEERLMMPNLAVGAFFEIARAPGVTGLAQTDDFTNPLNYTRAGFGLQLKGQFDYHSSFSKIRQAKGEMYKVDVQKELAEDGVELDVKEAFLDARNTKLDVARAEESGKLSRQLMFLTQSNYDIGLADSKDLIEALQAFLLTRGQYFEAVFNYNTALAKLDLKVGKYPE